MRIVATIIVAVLLLAGCSGGKDGTTGTPPASTPTAAPVAASTTPTVKPTMAPKPAAPAVLTRAQAATRYLAIVEPFNKLADDPKCAAVQDYTVNGGTWPPDGHSDWTDNPDKTAQSCFKRYAAAMDLEIKAIQKTAWPVDAAGDIADLVSLNQGDLHCYRQGSKAAAAAYDTYDCLPKDDGSADRVRARFGLPGRTPS